MTKPSEIIISTAMNEGLRKAETKIYDTLDQMAEDIKDIKRITTSLYLKGAQTPNGYQIGIFKEREWEK
jgi:chaperonin GroEL (HSP60 family)